MKILDLEKLSPEEAKEMLADLRTGNTVVIVD